MLIKSVVEYRSEVVDLQKEHPVINKYTDGWRA
jgi:hypothetical protein